MSPKSNLKKKNLIFLILQIHFLIFSLIGVLWVRNQFKKKFSTKKTSQTLERKAQFFPSPKDKKQPDNNKLK